MAVWQGWQWKWVLLGVFALVIGCTQSNPPEGGLADAGADEEAADLPTASIDRRAGEDDDDEAEDVDIAEPEQGSAEWQIREIVKLRLMPLPPRKQADDENAAAEDKAAKELEHQAAMQRERNVQVVKLAKQAIALTHDKPEKELVFNVAVNHLLDSRLQLALAGEQEDVDALYEIADALQRSKPNTDVSAAAALTIVNFAHANAVRFAQTEPKWIQEFAQQAKLFATRVIESQAAAGDGSNPQRAKQLEQDVSRAAQILMAAGQSCEASGLSDDAKACYGMLKSKFGETIPGQQVVGVVRRLNLKGQPLQLAGPTLDGNFLSIEDFKGKTVLVVFWSSQAKPFLDQLPALTELIKKAQKHVAVVGVNLDTDESQVDAFLESQDIHWPQIFYSEPEKRGWNSPVASYYGISNLPTVWIVDPAGVVAETDITAANVEPKLKEVVRQSLRTNKSNGENTIRQTGNTSGGK